jgi:hypothetical protein
LNPDYSQDDKKESVKLFIFFVVHQYYCDEQKQDKANEKGQ